MKIVSSHSSGQSNRNASKNTMSYTAAQQEALRNVPNPGNFENPAQRQTVHTVQALNAAQRKKIVQQNRKKKSKAANIVLTILLIIVLVGAGFGGWYYWWTTHATFEYSLQPIVILEGQSVDADDFLFPSENMERVSAVFRRPAFRPVAGVQTVPLTLTRGWRTVDATASLHVMTTLTQMHNEFRTPGPEWNAVDFVTNLEAAGGIPFDVHFTEDPMPLEEYEVGEFILHLSLNGAPFEVSLFIADTTPPTATAINKSIQIGEEVFPEDFVEDVDDASDILSIEFIEEPNTLAHRDQIVEVEVTDIHGNSAVFSAGLTIMLNQEPPTIEGTRTIQSMIGAAILYRQGVTAFDDFGRELEIDIDNSDVDTSTVGVYTVIYSAEDLSGLRIEVEETVYIIDIDPDDIDRQIDDIIKQITNDDMTQLDKVHAIYRYIRSNVAYSGVRGRPNSVYEGASIALQRRSGNCFVFYSLSELLLTRAGVPNMRIQRIDGTPTPHVWNLINPDDLGWHHFDSFPTRLGLGPRMALFTSTEAERFSREIRALGGLANYYTYDPELYPDIVQ